MIGIIAGSGFYELDGMKLVERISCDNEYGTPSGMLSKYEFNNKEIVFLPRHGENHTIPPHKVNYLANIRVLKDNGVTDIISVSAVGGIGKEFGPGQIVLADQIIDFTKSRRNSFFDEHEVVHIDFSEPYCNRLRSAFINAAKGVDFHLVESGVYTAVEGPRLETSAEIELFRAHGGDIIGMTAMPEAALAREAEMCYTGIYIVTNYAAGITKTRLTTTEVIEQMKDSKDRVRVLLSEALNLIQSDDACPCRTALKEARM